MNYPPHCRFDDEIEPTIETRNLKQGHREKLILHKNEIVFMMKGEIRFVFGHLSEKTIRSGEFFFVPVGQSRFIVREETSMIIVRLNEAIRFNDGCRIEHLYKPDQRGIPSKRVKRVVCSLQINTPLQHFLFSLIRSMESGLNCREYFDLKGKELFILMRAYYPIEQLRDFFSLILTSDTAFSEHIRVNHHHYRKVSELAASMNMGTKNFERMFSRVFGVSPGKWMNNERAQRLYLELCSGLKSMKQLTDECGFSTPQQLNRFCKRELGYNPSEIRQNAGKKIN